MVEPGAILIPLWLTDFFSNFTLFLKLFIPIAILVAVLIRHPKAIMIFGGIICIFSLIFLTIPDRMYGPYFTNKLFIPSYFIGMCFFASGYLAKMKNIFRFHKAINITISFVLVIILPYIAGYLSFMIVFRDYL